MECHQKQRFHHTEIGILAKHSDKLKPRMKIGVYQANMDFTSANIGVKQQNGCSLSCRTFKLDPSS